MKKLALGFALVLLTVNAEAATVVATCGSPPVTYSPGSTRPVTVDTNGNTCT